MNEKKSQTGDMLTDLVIICLFIVIGLSYPPASPLFFIFIIGAITFLFSSDVVAEFLGLSLQFKNGIRLAAYGISALGMIVFLFDLVANVKLF